MDYSPHYVAHEVFIPSSFKRSADEKEGFN